MRQHRLISQKKGSKTGQVDHGGHPIRWTYEVEYICNRLKDINIQISLILKDDLMNMIVLIIKCVHDFCSDLTPSGDAPLHGCRNCKRLNASTWRTFCMCYKKKCWNGWNDIYKCMQCACVIGPWSNSIVRSNGPHALVFSFTCRCHQCMRCRCH